jgi:predicted P-loop ATPase
MEEDKVGQFCDDEDYEYEETELYWHEALDRSYVACDHFYEYVQQHIAVQHDTELEEAATAVTDAMQDFYQLVGRKSHAFSLKSGKTHD